MAMATTLTTCPLDCPDACGVVVEADERGQFVRLKGDPSHGFSRGTLCSKTAHYGDLLRSPERLLTPLVRDGRALRPASWDEAIARIVERVRGVPGERILAAWYAGSMGRVALRFPLRMMHALGAVLVDGGLCDATSTAGYETVLGPPIGFDLEQVDQCDFALLWGCDMSRTVQHLQPAVRRLARAGAPVVVIDVYETDTIRRVQRWGGRGIVVKPGTDAQLALALCRLAYERGYADRAFLTEQCVGADAFEAHVRAAHDLAGTAAITGIDAATIERLADELGRALNPLVKTGVGFARRRVGAMSMRAVASLVAVLGKPGAIHYESFGVFELGESVIPRPQLRPGKKPALTIHHVQLGAALDSDRFSVLFVWGHNPAVTCPDAAAVRRGLERDDLFVVVHEQFLTETASRADVVLPATMFPEHEDIYRSYGHRRLRWAKKACEPPPGPRSNVAAFAAIARALDLPPVTWDVTDHGLCEELVEASRHRLSDEQVARLRRGEAVTLVPPPRSGWGTPSGKIELASEAARENGQPAMATYVADDACGGGGRFWLIAAPSVHTHNSTFNHSARHAARRGPAVVHVNPQDALTLGLAEGAWATLSNERAHISLPVQLAPEMPAGLVRIDGVPGESDTPERVGVNALVAGALSDLGTGNVLYSTRVDLHPAAGLR
jgi:anaerobic selenocysteine-containing dehydrogenase